MAGIFGVINFSGTDYDYNEIVKKNANLSHRGQEEEGCFFVNINQSLINNAIGCHDDLSMPKTLFIQRNSSREGNLTLKNKDNYTYCVLFDGKIFNKKELLSNLGSYQNNAMSDSEMLLELYLEFGLEFVNYVNGVWSFVIFDLKKKTLLCSRDRLGQKPFYYYFRNGFFCFASEIKQLLSLPWVETSLSKDSSYNYLHHNSDAIPPYTFYENISSMLPGSFLALNLQSKELKTFKYWDIDERRERIQYSETEVKAKYLEILTGALSKYLDENNSGFALSGGLDSSSLIALAYKEKKQFPYKVYSVVVEDSDFDDTALQTILSDKVGAERVIIRLNEKEIEANLEDILNAHDAPFTPTAFGRWMLYKSLKDHNVDNIIEGWGNDQLLGGYEVHTKVYFEYLVQTGRFTELFKEIENVKKRATRVGETVNVSIQQIIRNALANFDICQKYKYKLKKILPSKNRNDFLFKLMPFEECDNSYSKQIDQRLEGKKFRNYFDRFMYTSLLIGGLPFGLRVTDTNSMHHGVNIKLPFLDHNYVEFCFNLPPELKINRGFGKYIMREAMEDMVPNQVRYRDSKRGLEIPERKWFDGGFKKIADNIRNLESDYFDKQELSKLITSFYDGNKQLSPVLWRSFNLVFLEYRLKGINILK